MWRQLQEMLLTWEWADCPETLALWVHLLLRANTEDRKWQGIEVPRGSLATSLDNLSRQTGLTIQQIRTNLKRLKSTSKITIKATYKCTIITICEYESYGFDFGDINKPFNKPFNKPSTNHQQTTNKPDTAVSDCGTGNSEREGDSVNKPTDEKDVKSGVENPENEVVSKEKVTQRENIINTTLEDKKITLTKENSAKEKCSLIKKPEAEIKAIGVEVKKTVCRTKTEFDLSFVDEKLLEVFEEFMAMRRKIRKPLKTIIGVKARYNTLVKLSHGNTDLAKRIARQSIEYEWQDFYDLKTDNKPKTATAQTYKNDKYW